MAIVFVNETGKFRTASGASVGGNFSVLPVAGNAIIVTAFFWNAVDPSTVTVTDNQGNPAYTQAVYSALNVNVRAGVWFLPATVAPGGTFTVTVACAASSVIVANAMEWSGLDPTAPLDQTASNTGLSSAATTGTTGTTTAADELLVATGAFNTDSAFPWIITGGWTERLSEDDGTTYIEGSGVTQVVAATGAHQHTWTLANVRLFSCGIATFKATAPAGGAGDQRRRRRGE